MSDMHWQAPVQDRIREHTSEATQRRIDESTLGAISAAAGSRADLEARLARVEREWDIDRALMLNFSIAGAVAAFNAMRELRRDGFPGRWSLLLSVQLGFLAYHAVKGWCPPMAVLRRLGFRSAKEISAERLALHEALGS